MIMHRSIVLKEILSYFDWLMNKLIQMGYDEKEVLDFVEKDYYSKRRNSETWS